MKNSLSLNTYNVPLIPSDLRRDECIIQIADALEYLDQVANDVFTRIGGRVEDNKKRLLAVNDRINVAQARIDKIKGTSKATKVFSSAKYPASDELQGYQTLFLGETTDTNLKEIRRARQKVQSKYVDVDENVLKDKLQFYNVQQGAKKRDENEQEGIGRLPRNIPSVSSLLLFNTSENPYKKYVMLDPLGVVTKTRATEGEEEDALAAAPSSIAHGEEMQRGKTENYFYVPDLGEVPEISVPDFLPDLLGIADDISYAADLGPSIAPSVPGSNMPDLPSVVPEIDSIPSGPAPVGGMSSSSGPGDLLPPGPGAAPPPPPPPAAAPPPPPPPPPPPSAAAPPPPPPPAVTPVSPPEPKIKEAPSEVEDAGDDRSSLLAAIRGAGGSKGAGLKKIGAEKRKERKKKEAAPPPSSGGDFMSDLFSRIQRRREGISGSKTPGGGEKSGGGGNQSSGSALDTMSKMIPPARDRSESIPAHDDEDDWE